MTEAVTVDAARATALATLDAVLARPPAQLEAALERAAGRFGPDARDRGFARVLVTTVLRRKGQLDGVLRRYVKFMPDALVAQNLLRLGAAQLLLLETPAHAAVSATVALARSQKRPEAGLINAVLRKVAAERPKLPSPQKNAPPWLWQSWVEAYGEDVARAIGAAHLEEPPLDLTVPVDRAAWAERLGGQLVGPATVRLEHAGLVPDLPGFAEGAWWVQDVAATLPVSSLGEVQGLRVLDVGAAPGGKTAQLAAGGARVTAVEADAGRASRLRENLARLRLEVDVVVCELADFDAQQPFDVVLIDAPCTATGTIRRHPDIPWHRSAKDVITQAAKQRAMLDLAPALLRPGGRLVFATCSLQPEEGEALVAAWLAATPAVRRVAAVVDPPASLHLRSDAVGQWRTLPHAIPGGMDGFFFAHFERSSETHD
ncbi:MAG: methyltransferase domain-containing protein [Geminicoccaceae bacterium]|nr:MAG: methyltransferase domain-containing protein [Geminicoccaceae bacterium]